MKRYLFLAIVSALLIGPARASNLEISLSNAQLGALAGQTVEWDATLSDPVDLASGYSILFDGSSFVNSVGGTQAPGTPYTDLLGAAFVVLAPVGNTPGDPQSVSNQPIGTYTIPFSAPVGVPVSGFLEIDYSIYSVDPNDSANWDPSDWIADVQTFTPVSVTSTPEPAAMLLAAGGLGLLAWRRRRARQ